MATSPSPRSRTSDAETRIGWQMAALGFEVAGSVLAGAGLGWLSDRFLGTTKGVLVGSIIGIAVGLFTLIRRSLRLNKRLDQISRRRRAASPPPPPAPAPGEERDEWDEKWKRKWGDEDDGDDDDRGS